MGNNFRDLKCRYAGEVKEGGDTIFLSFCTLERNRTVCGKTIENISWNQFDVGFILVVNSRKMVKVNFCNFHNLLMKYKLKENDIHNIQSKFSHNKFTAGFQQK